jgi:hypothetical protein
MPDARGRDSGDVQPQPSSRGTAADRHQHAIRCRRSWNRRPDGRRAVEPLDGGAEMETDALSFQRSLDDVGDQWILRREQTVLEFDDVDLRADRCERRRHLDRDRAAADDQQCGRGRLQLEQAARS